MRELLYCGGLYLGIIFSFKSDVVLRWLLDLGEGVVRKEEEDFGLGLVVEGGSARTLLTLFCSCASSAVLTRSLFSRVITSCTEQHSL